jgi:Xaa-Pro aminopeptidase
MHNPRLLEARRQAEAQGWGPPFSDAEYASRIQRVTKKMRAAGIDTLLVTSPANITYLTGYDMVWYYLRTPSAVVVRAEDASTLFYELEYHRPTVEFHAVVQDVSCFESFEGAANFVVEDLNRRGWASGCVALELWSRNPNGAVLTELRTGLESKHAEVVDGSWLVDTVRLIKSDNEMTVLREASRIADTAMQTVGEAVQVGVTETELAGIALCAMMKEGGGDPAIRVAIRSGPRFLARHCAPSHRRLKHGELVWVNFCASYHRYHCDLGRLVSIGPPDERWRNLIDTASDIADCVLPGVMPGEATQSVQDRADAAIDEAGLRHLSVLIGGYDMGIASPPDWVGHTFTKSARGFVEAHYDIGMATNFEFLFRAGEGWRGGAGGGFIDTVMMCDGGLEVLSKLPRAILVND